MAVLPVAHNYPMSSPGTFGTFYAGGKVVLATGVVRMRHLHLSKRKSYDYCSRTAISNDMA